MEEKSAEKELLEQLNTDKRSVKIQAIVKLARVGQSEQALKAVIPVMTIQDRELSFFAVQAANKIAQKLGINLSTYTNQPQYSQTNSNNTINRDSFLNADSTNAPKLLKIVREQTANIPQDWLPAIGTFLVKYGSKIDANFIKKQLLNDNSNLCLPFLNAAERHAKEILPEVLPNLLASQESLVRSRAISLLQKIDPQEAEHHFTDLLVSRNAENRLAAISLAMMFPFERVKNYLISLLADETDKDIISACQTVLVSNPNLDTALCILDKYDTVSPAHKNVLSHVFKFVCKSLEITGILTREDSKPENVIIIWKKNRLERFLSDLEIRLSLANNEQKKPLIDWLNKNRNNYKVEEFIRKLEFNPQTENVYRILMGLPTIEEEESTSNFFNSKNVTNNKPIKETQVSKEVQSNNNSFAATPEESINKNDSINDVAENQQIFKEQSIEVKVIDQDSAEQTGIQNKQSDIQPLQNNQTISDLIKQLKNIDLENAKENKNFVLDIVSDDSEQNAKLKAEAINTMVRAYRGPKLIEIAKKGILSPYEPVKISSFKALERTNPDYLHTILPNLLKEESENIRVRAIRFAVKQDPQSAVSSLKQMLSSEDDKIRANAVSCMGLCPFEHTAKNLINRLSVEEHPLIAKQITSIILNNPSKTMLQALDTLCSTAKSSIAMEISQARNSMEALVSQLPQTQTEDEKSLEEELFDNIENKSNKPYSISNVRALKAKQEKKEKTNNSNKIKDLMLPISAGVLALTLLIVVCYFASTKEPAPKKKPKSAYNFKKSTKPSLRGGRQNGSQGLKANFKAADLMINKANHITGASVISIDSEKNILIEYKKTKFYVKLDKVVPTKLKPRSKISLTITPYGINSKKIVQANGKNIKLQND